MRIHKEGIEGVRLNTAIFALITAVVTATGLVYDWAWWALAIVDAFLLWRILFVIRFFRDPERPLVQDVRGVFSPADGKVVVIEEVDEPEVMGGRCIQLSVYMNFYNVHVNWYPVAGEVEYFKYHPGKFLVAWHPKSSEENERTTTVVNTGKHKVLFRQIAGFVARRIVSYAEVGKKVEQNSKCGFIKFGSRVDLLLPLDCEPLVKIGDKVVGSQTPLVRLK